MLLDDWRYHTDSEILILEDIKKSKLSIDKISQFSIRPPELRCLIDQVGNYYRWFEVLNEELNEDTMRNFLSDNLISSSWIDGMQRIVKLRRKALPEVIDYINNKMHHHDYCDKHSGIRSTRGRCSSSTNSSSSSFIIIIIGSSSTSAGKGSSSSSTSNSGNSTSNNSSSCR